MNSNDKSRNISLGCDMVECPTGEQEILAALPGILRQAYMAHAISNYDYNNARGPAIVQGCASFATSKAKTAISMALKDMPLSRYREWKLAKENCLCYVAAISPAIFLECRKNAIATIGSLK